MLLHSRQKRKVICSWAFVGWASAERLEGAGDAMVGIAVAVGVKWCELLYCKSVAVAVDKKSFQ